MHGNGCIWQCYDFISSTCDPRQPRFMLAPSFGFTPSITSHFSFLSFSPFPPPCLIHGWGWCSDRPTLWCALLHLLPRSKPPFQEPNPPEGLKDSSFFYNSHMLYNRLLEVRSGVRDQGCNVVHLPPIVCPRLHYEDGRRGISTAQKETLGQRKERQCFSGSRLFW